MGHAPKPIHDAAAAFDSLPGIGPRAALRFAYWLAGQPKEFVRRFARSFDAVSEDINRCETCGAWAEGPHCDVCKDPKRDQTSLCVVATSQDVRVIEESGAFTGRYHVLGGMLDPIEGKTPDTLRIQELLTRLRAPDSRIRELILALDPDVMGDTTAMYLTRQLAGLPITVTRLARGLQHGAQIEYADGTTITDALSNRKKI